MYAGKFSVAIKNSIRPNKRLENNLLRKFNLICLYRSQEIQKRLLYTGIQKWDEDLTTDIKLEIEKHWKSATKPTSFEVDSKKPKFYVLSMFPYPSGKLHMGHVRVYAICDTMARFHRMTGKNVLHPIGWDAFGLPAENAAIEHGVEPSEWTKQNIEHMKRQLKHLNCSFDWDREFATCDPSYYRWTQFIFLKLYESGLVYRKESMVNWDPVDQTVLADEQVDEAGCSWRSGTKVEKKILKQWFISTSRLSKSLCDGLNDPILKNWRDIIKIQKHWIGDCDGVTFEFELNSSDQEKKGTVKFWTNKPSSVYRASFIAVSPGSLLDLLYDSEHDNNNNYKKLYVNVHNPFTGQSLPIYVTDRLCYNRGADTYLGVPSDSEADRLFADLVGITPSSSSVPNVSNLDEHVCSEAKRLGIGGYTSSSNLHDWLISRQRYWGTPIPMVYCNSCEEPQPVPYEYLPVTLPKITQLSGKGKSPLLEAKDWLHTKCPKCGGEAVRETDTMDTFVDSSWYFTRFTDPHNTNEPFDKKKAYELLPVDVYVGGKEHAVLHLYYARFMTHFLHQINLVPHPEPFKELVVQGLVMGQTYRIKGTGQYITKDKVDFTDEGPVVKSTREPIVVAWEKMSKSKHNGVDPEEMFENYGVDFTRLLLLANVAPTSNRHWSHDTFPGILKWQNRLWLTVKQFIKLRNELSEDALSNPPDSPEFKVGEELMFDNRNFYAKGTTFNYVESYQLSVAISKLQGLTNSLRKASPEVMAQGLQFERALACQIILLAPMAPHFASELWAGFVSAPHRRNVASDEIQWDKGVLEQNWPVLDPNYQLELQCMVNGREVCSIRLSQPSLNVLTREVAMEMALSDIKLQEITKNEIIKHTSFILNPGYKAILDFHTKKRKKEKATKIVASSE